MGMGDLPRIAHIFRSSPLVYLIATLDSATTMENPAHLVRGVFRHRYSLHFLRTVYVRNRIHAVEIQFSRGAEERRIHIPVLGGRPTYRRKRHLLLRNTQQARNETVTRVRGSIPGIHRARRHHGRHLTEQSARRRHEHLCRAGVQAAT